MNTKTFAGIFFLCTLWLLSSTVTAQDIATITGNNVNVNNGIISAFIEGGRMKSLNLNDQANLLNNKGYGYFSYYDIDGFYSPTSLTPKVKLNNAEIADIYFEHINNFKVEMHYVFRKDESGFYTYFIISDNDKMYKTMQEVRFALRVDKEIFDYAWTVEREGPMIHPDLLENYVEEIQDATYRISDGSIYTKYDWSVYRMYDTHHGLMGNGTGVWNIEASREYINGGPTMQDLTLHGTSTTPILLSTFNTTHYGSEVINLKREYSKWSKIWGPTFIYINSGTNEEIIADAEEKSDELEKEWPYKWLNHELYPLERGTLSGNLNMNGYGEVDSAMVLLCKSGPSWFLQNAHWQRQSYDYFFWDEADENGNFQLKNVRPGTYELYAFTQKGKLIDELKVEDIQVNTGENNAGTIEWDAGDKKKTIFEIGTADHKSGEFKLANLPRLYGRWKDTPDNLTYTVGTDNDREGWYYCQRENTYWDINFSVSNLSSLLNPTLRIALAGADAKPHINAILNGTSVTVQHLGTDSGIRRSSLTGGKYTDFKVAIDKELLIEGANTLTMNCYGSSGEYKGVMYDAILLEADVDDGTGISDTELGQKYRIYNRDKQIIIDSDSNQNAVVRIYSLTGSLLYHGQIEYGSNPIKVVKNGVYIVSLTDGKSIVNKRVLCN